MIKIIQNKVFSLIFLIILFKFVGSRLNNKLDYSKPFILGYSKSSEIDFYTDYIKWDSIDGLVIPTNLSNFKEIVQIIQSKKVLAILNIEGNTLNDTLIDQYINLVIDSQVDGISLIFFKNPTSDSEYLKKVERMGTELKAISENIHFSVSISIINVPYSYEKLLKLEYVDYVIANSYDMGNFIGQVSQNSPTNRIKKEIEKWVVRTLKRNLNKIILSIPWYGYKYECDKFPRGLYTSECVNSRSPKYIEFNEIYNYLIGNKIENKTYVASAEIWNQDSLNPYINIRRIESQTSKHFSYHQIQYDNPLSTYHKINGSCFGGIGIYSLDSLHGLNQNTIQSMYLSIDRNLIKSNFGQCIK